MNNKGFSLVELLAVIVIISLLAVLGVVGYTKYIDYTKQKAYDFMATSAKNATAEYTMDYIGIDSVTLEELTENEYMEFPTDPSQKGKACKGKVDITYNESDEGLDTEDYEVYICCSNYTYKYEYKYELEKVKKTKLETCPVE